MTTSARPAGTSDTLIVDYAWVANHALATRNSTLATIATALKGIHKGTTARSTTAGHWHTILAALDELPPNFTSGDRHVDEVLDVCKRGGKRNFRFLDHDLDMPAGPDGPMARPDVVIMPPPAASVTRPAVISI